MHLVIWHSRRNSASPWQFMERRTFPLMWDAVAHMEECADMNEQHGWRKYRVIVITLD